VAFHSFCKRGEEKRGREERLLTVDATVSQGNLPPWWSLVLPSKWMHWSGEDRDDFSDPSSGCTGFECRPSSYSSEAAVLFFMYFIHANTEVAPASWYAASLMLGGGTR
jgi:hypothetical protein